MLRALVLSLAALLACPGRVAFGPSETRAATPTASRARHGLDRHRPLPGDQRQGRLDDAPTAYDEPDEFGSPDGAPPPDGARTIDWTAGRDSAFAPRDALRLPAPTSHLPPLRC
jgi:hypothetical protein